MPDTTLPRRASWITLLLVVFGPCWSAVRADDDLLQRAGLQPPGKNVQDEPVAEQFSLARAVRFLDAAALDWQQNRRCFTCHTNFAYLYARPGLPGDDRPPTWVRDFAEELVEKRWPDKGPRWDAEVVAAAAALAFNDARATGKLSAAARTALDRMWTVQQADGSWKWLKCDWPPMESDDHYGATLAAIAVGVAPDGYANSAAARAGIQKIRAYLQANPGPAVHHRAMVVWAASYLPDLLTEEARQACIAELKALQRPDGGWSAASLGDWRRGDGLQQDRDTSDGYGTGFVLFILRRAGEPATAPELQRGVDWLKSHQRVSGRWFTRSLFKDNHHFLTHAGTAFAIMALHECGAIEGGKVALR